MYYILVKKENIEIGNRSVFENLSSQLGHVTY